MEKKGEKRGIYLLVISSFIIVLLITGVSAGILDWMKETITGKATSAPISMNITVGVPTIYHVMNESFTTLTINNAPALTELEINFSVNNPSGAGNINISTAQINVSNLSYNGVIRQNTTCIMYEASGNDANFTCNVSMWWWDANGSYLIAASVEDNSSNSITNATTTVRPSDSAGFAGGPYEIVWTGIAAGSTNNTPTSSLPYVLNNTGNVDVNPAAIEVNATNLRGEQTPGLALWATNFTLDYATGGSPPTECDGTNMVNHTYTGVATANLTKGNYTPINGTGQENLYFCLQKAGTELTTQSYSTITEGNWTIRIVTT